MKLKLFTFTLLIVIVTGVFLLFDKEQNKRKKYEIFLKELFKDANIPEVEGVNDDIKPDRPDLAFFQNYIMTLDPKTGTVPSDRLKKVAISRWVTGSAAEVKAADRPWPSS